MVKPHQTEVSQQKQPLLKAENILSDALEYKKMPRNDKRLLKKLFREWCPRRDSNL